MKLRTDDNNNLVGLLAPSGTVTVLDGRSANASLASSTVDRGFRIHSSGITTNYKLGATAATNGIPIPDKMVEYIIVPAGMTLNCYGGILTVVELQ